MITDIPAAVDGGNICKKTLSPASAAMFFLIRHCCDKTRARILNSTPNFFYFVEK